MKDVYVSPWTMLLMIAVVLVGSVGWVLNIVKLVQSDFAVITGMFVVRCIGVFIAPLGSVLGFL